MEFVPAEKCARASLIFSIGTGIAVNTLWVQNTAEDWSVPTLATLCGILRDWWDTNWKSKVTNEVTLNSIVAKDWAVKDSYAYELPCNIVGTRGNDAVLPMNVTAAVKFLTGRAGRSFRGRNFVVGLCKSQVMGDGILTQVRDDILAAYNALQADLSEDTFQHVVVSFQHDKVKLVTGMVTAVQSYNMDVVLDSQRRRLAGRGV